MIKAIANRKYQAIFLAILTFSLVLNIMSLFNQSIRLDESQSIWAAGKSIPALMKYIGEDVHVPLYHLLLHFWMQFFGTDIVVVRLLSLLFFGLTLLALLKLANYVANRQISILAAALFSLSPFIVWYSNEARMYTLFTFVVTLNHFYFLQVLNSHGRFGKFGLFITSLLGFYTHYFFIFMIFSQFTYASIKEIRTLIDEVKNGPRTFRHYFIIKFRSFLSYFFPVITAFMFFIPWLIFVLRLGFGSNTSPQLTRPTAYNIFQTFVNFIFGFQGGSLSAALISLWPLSVMLLFFVFTKRIKFELKNTHYLVVVTVLPVIVAFLASYIKPLYLSRYLILTTPTLFIILGWLVLNYTRRLLSLSTLVVLAVMLFFLSYQDSSAATPVKENYAGVARYLEKSAKPQDVVAVSAPFTVYPLEYNYKGNVKLDTIPPWDRYQTGAIPRFTPQLLQSQVKDYSRVYRNIYLVLSYDQGYENTIRDYMDKHYQLLQKKEYPPSIEVRVYKLRYD